ncbi:DUF397 domain-containing protein [Streptomyces sp. NPDC054933]
MHTPRPELSGAIWRTSSYSDNQGGECVEVAEAFPGSATWRKSKHSNNTGGDCVEVADGHRDGLVPVRDSKDPNGPALIFTANAWTAFVKGLKAGDFPTSA